MSLYLFVAVLFRRFNLQDYTYMSFLFALFYFVLIQAYPHIPTGNISEQNICSGEIQRSPSSKPGNNPTTWDKFLYFSSMLALTNSLIASIAYWAFLYPGSKQTWWETMIFGAIPHGLSFVLTAVDVIFFSNMKYRCRHISVPILFGCAYIIFGLLFYAVNKIWLYGFLNFTSIAAAYGYPIVVGCCILFSLLFVFISRIRRRVVGDHTSSPTAFQKVEDSRTVGPRMGQAEGSMASMESEPILRDT
ncbi:hypothetical protein BLNAU_16604 [Blattamonas nauphoetae]|uniref:Uncharacterized protein n=1 Tax=Blattamonas nauphoetae TaxID=2049346 RepID=A0ABQ9X9Q7_9EUKA|nr:hypothetical protein BLNAU_16604 [Blattamonas nauphoetae]